MVCRTWKDPETGVTGIIWRDDSQVVRIFADKYYSETPRIEFEVSTISGEEAAPL